MACPACDWGDAPSIVERRRDPIGGKEYALCLCPACAVVFSDPRDPVGPDWYEKAAPLRALEKRPAPEDDWRFSQFFSDPVPPGKLLDVGCGDGSFLALAKRRGFSAAGFDYEARMVELAKSRGIEDVEAAEFGAYCARRKAAEFDVITLFDVLEHTPEPKKFLWTLKRLLKPGGRLAVTLPNANRPLPWGREIHDYPPHHYTRWTPKTLRDFLERNGFRVERQDASHLKVYFLAESIYFFLITPVLVGLAKRLLFRGAKADATLTELYSAPAPAEAPARGGLRGLLKDKGLRQRLVNAFKALCAVATYPAAAVMAVFYRLFRKDCGDCLYTLAVLERP